MLVAAPGCKVSALLSRAYGTGPFARAGSPRTEVLGYSRRSLRDRGEGDLFTPSEAVVSVTFAKAFLAGHHVTVRMDDRERREVSAHSCSLKVLPWR
jgi:hypothetical protein